MPRLLQDQRPVQNIQRVVPVSMGGTGATNLSDALDNLGGVPKGWINAPGGVLGLDDEGNIPERALSSLAGARGHAVDGPSVVQHGSRVLYRLTAANLYDKLVCSATDGATVEAGDRSFYVTAPSQGSSFVLTVNGRSIVIRLTPQGLTPPEIKSPLTDENVPSSFTFTSSRMEDFTLRYSNEYSLVTGAITVPARVIAVELLGNEGESGLAEISFRGKNYGIGKADTNRVVYLDGVTEISATVTGTAACTYRWILSDRIHYSSDWKVATDPDFSNIVFSSYEDRVNLRSLTLFLPSGEYYAAVRYNATVYEEEAPPPPAPGEVPQPATPTITFPTQNASDVTWPITFRSSAFAVVAGSDPDTHSKTDWQLSLDAQFSNVIYSSDGSSADLTSWMVNTLSFSTSYFVRVRHYGAAGRVSAWSTVTQFTSVAAPAVVVDTVFENGTTLLSPELEKFSAGFGYNVAMEGGGLEFLVAHLYSDRYSTGEAGVVDRGNVRHYVRGSDGVIAAPLALKPQNTISVTIPTGFYPYVNVSGPGFSLDITNTSTVVLPEISGDITISGLGSNGSRAQTFYRHQTVRYVLHSDPSVILTASNHSSGTFASGAGFAKQSASNLSTVSWSPASSLTGTVRLNGPGITNKTGTFTIYYSSSGDRATAFGEWAYWLGTVTNDAGQTIQVRIMYKDAHEGSYQSGGSDGVAASATFLGKSYSFPGGTSTSPSPSLTSFTGIKSFQKEAFFGHSIALDKSSADSVVRAYASMLNKATSSIDDVQQGVVFVYQLPSQVPDETIISPDTVDGKTDSFGFRLSVPQDSELLAVADTDVSVNGSLNAGRVYIYKRSGADWVLERRIDRGVSALPNDRYGSELSFQKDPVTGNFILAIKANNRVEIYSRTENAGTATWSLSQSITPLQGESFAGSIALAKGCSRLVVSSGTKNVYIYDRNASTFTYTRSATVLEIRHPNKDTTATSGRNIAISEAGTTIVVPSYDLTSKGQMDVFKFQDGTWKFIKTLTPPSSDYNSAGSSFGWSLDMSDDGTKLLSGLNDLDMPTTSFVNYAY